MQDGSETLLARKPCLSRISGSHARQLNPRCSWFCRNKDITCRQAHLAQMHQGVSVQVCALGEALEAVGSALRHGLAGGRRALQGIAAGR